MGTVLILYVGLDSMFDLGLRSIELQSLVLRLR